MDNETPPTKSQEAQANSAPSKSTVERIAQVAQEAPDSIFQFIQDVTDRLTIKRILLVLLASLIATLSAFSYDNRTLLFDSFIKIIVGTKESLVWELSKETKIDLVKLVRNSNHINFVSVSQIDLQKNRRIVKFWELENQKIAVEIREKVAMMLPISIFDEDGRNTSQILTVLNGDFICTPFEDTVFYKHFAELSREVPFICRTSIPPIYGHAVGILTIGLKSKPSQSEIVVIKQEIMDLSSKIYMRDIVKRYPPSDLK